jgi:hypothetical protein
MAGSLERPVLLVEGDDDLHSLAHLLIRKGINYDAKPWPALYPEIAVAGDVAKLMKAIRLAVSVANGRSVGFVLDADADLMNRWGEVRRELLKVGIDAPTAPVPTGFIGHSDRYQARVGVWLMPDNERDGSLEDFLKTLIADGDSLIEHASTTTDSASRLGAKFRPIDRTKAVIHAWLAWQEDPGRPYGKAIRYRYFSCDSVVAESFVTWFRSLYGIS